MEAQFSRRTVIAAIDALKTAFSQASISALLTDFGPAVYTQVRGEEVSASKRMTDLKQFVDMHPRHPTDDGLLENVLVERALSLLPPDDSKYEWSQPAYLSPELERLKRLLEQDGFVVTDGALRRQLPGDIDLPEAESELTRLLEQYQFTNAKGHLEQAFDAHARGNWAGANGQLRTFLESLLDELTVRIDPSAASIPSGHARRAKLASLGFLFIPLNEWGDDGKGFLNGLVRRLHPAGAHPGLSDEEDSTFRLHIVLVTAALLLRRFHGGSLE